MMPRYQVWELSMQLLI